MRMYSLRHLQQVAGQRIGIGSTQTLCLRCRSTRSWRSIPASVSCFSAVVLNSNGNCGKLGPFRTMSCGVSCMLFAGKGFFDRSQSDRQPCFYIKGCDVQMDGEPLLRFTDGREVVM